MLGTLVALSAVFLAIPHPTFDWKADVLPDAQRYMQQPTTNETPLKGMVIAITGATSGIGLELTLTLNKLGATVLAIGRSPKKLKDLFGQEEGIETVLADLSDLASVANASQYILEHYDHLDVLVNNAGMHSGIPGLWERPTTEQGYDSTFGVNYLSHFLLTEKLLPLMEKSSEHPKVLQISSSFHYGVDGSDLGGATPVASLPGGSHGFFAYRSQRQYANSKLAQILHARSLKKRHKQITAVSACPSWVGTEIGAGRGTLAHSLFTKVAFPVNGYGLSSILHALFDDDNSSNANNHDFYVNVDFGIPIVLDYLPSWTYSVLPIWDVVTSAFAMALLSFQRFFPVKIARTSSRASYNEQLQEELYEWSKTAVSEWL